MSIDRIEHTDVLVIGGGQAGLSAAYFLHRTGLGGDYQLLDQAPEPGGAWQFRWPTLTLAAANRVHDLPGYGLQEALGTDCDELPAASSVPRYFGDYESRFGLHVRRPVGVRAVHRDPSGPRYRITTADGTTMTAATIINASGTWDRPFVPYISGIDTFRGRQLHTHDYRRPEEFAGRRVLVVGAGISAIQLLIEIARNAPGVRTFWCSRREPTFTDGPFTPDQGRAAVARVEQRVRAGLPPTSVVSVTGLRNTPSITAARADGILAWRPMFTAITDTGVLWACGDGPDEELAVDTIFWNTGFRSSLDHLAPLRLRAPGGGITMTGRLATVVADDPYVQLLGYGPSASTIGANRAGRAAAAHVADLLGN
ncbi:SidA/IucD/PvdA family monooxygenase [Gordonia pseudamarae]|uniref:SidA/IucD/PvdA family monooxygenase n=1 Tax=Gordonia pseudamarae TaxID=2831662 RepID=A0ABX6IEX6_9ACTN|nr:MULTISPECIES: NAD(P)-binding domain-containing protein [Gordonia]MBD0023652.1 NAD(P)/FAD-dependent oxidoreductase [Gordonia sp. (in: high G+C Gram-positive bacteria)]QHN25464.1 SidA/IucD/PvdA family monooxygenase [Gordonia pseudamarae]QHN34396.1 SidA/IucD/PvdA family monooxygenase [Gordonia pseudamarae]